MTDIQVFELDDDFDPLEDMGLTADDDFEEHDYLAPIPDADRSIVPEPEKLSFEQRMKKLLHGVPGQKQRFLRVVSLCANPMTIAEIGADLEETHPQTGSVYDPARIVQLLAEAGALACLDETAEAVEAEPQGAESAQRDAETAAQDAGADYLEVSPREPSHYLATDEGLAYVAENESVTLVEQVLAEEPIYLPIYERILKLTSADGGCGKKELNAVIDGDPLCQEPRRYTEYFLARLESAGGVRWNHTWIATDSGRTALSAIQAD